MVVILKLNLDQLVTYLKTVTSMRALNPWVHCSLAMFLINSIFHPLAGHSFPNPGLRGLCSRTETGKFEGFLMDLAPITPMSETS